MPREPNTTPDVDELLPWQAEELADFVDPYRRRVAYDDGLDVEDRE